MGTLPIPSVNLSTTKDTMILIAGIAVVCALVGASQPKATKSVLKSAGCIITLKMPKSCKAPVPQVKP